MLLALVSTAVALVVAIVLVWILFQNERDQSREHQALLDGLSKAHGAAQREAASAAHQAFSDALRTIRDQQASYEQILQTERNRNGEFVRELIQKVQSPEENYRRALEAMWQPYQAVQDETQDAEEKWARDPDSYPDIDPDLAVLAAEEE